MTGNLLCFVRQYSQLPRTAPGQPFQIGRTDSMARQPFIIAQFLKLLPRYEFQRIANKYKGDYRSKHFKCWDQLACMIFAQIRQEGSLRDIDHSLNAHAAKLYHIGIQQCPKSTLADANERRDYRIYEEFAKTMMQRARREYANTELAIDVDSAVYALDAYSDDSDHRFRGKAPTDSD
jgi:hypothetical protein